MYKRQGYYYLNKKDTYEYYKINEQDPSDYELSFLADIQYYDYSWKIAQPCLNIFNGVIMITGAINIYESVRIGFWDGECSVSYTHLLRKTNYWE